MDQLLRPGGTMIHKVDLRDHGMFSEGGQNALTFLTLGDRTYRWMGEESAGLPNRVLIGWYRDELAGLGYESKYLVTHFAGVDDELIPAVPLDGRGPTRGRSPPSPTSGRGSSGSSGGCRTRSSRSRGSSCRSQAGPLGPDVQRQGQDRTRQGRGHARQHRPPGGGERLAVEGAIRLDPERFERPCA